jgi:hypothetical protein
MRKPRRAKPWSKKWAPEMTRKSKHAKMFSKNGVDLGSFWGRSGVLRDDSGGQEVCFLMGDKNFEGPWAVDIEISM